MAVVGLAELRLREATCGVCAVLGMVAGDCVGVLECVAGVG